MKDVCCCCGLSKKEQESLPSDFTEDHQILKFDYMSQVINWHDSYVKNSLPKKVKVISRNFTENQLSYLEKEDIEVLQLRDNIYEDGLIYFYRYKKGVFVAYK